MKNIEVWFWMMRDEWGRRHKSVCRFTEQEALRRDPTAMRAEGSCESRSCPEPGDIDRWSNSAFKGSKGKLDGSPMAR